MQIFANGKQRLLILFFHGVLCDIPKENQGLKFDHSTTLKFTIPRTDPTHQYTVPRYFS